MNAQERACSRFRAQRGTVMYEWCIMALIIAVGLIIGILNLAAGTNAVFEDPQLEKALTAN